MEKAKKLFNNKKVLIMGLGTKGGGVASAKFAHKHGASLTITDLQDEQYLLSSLNELSGIPKKLILGRHNLVDFETQDIIIKNPGIKYSNKYLQHAKAHNINITIETPISLFLKLYKRPFIGITGTKGKSYTTALTSHLLSTLGIKNIAAGNNCVSPLDYVDKDLDFVLELSSWQLHEMDIQKKSPNIACWLNFSPDHLNHYSSVNEYFNDKSEILNNQNKNDFCILPYEYTKIRNLAVCNNKILYSISDLSKYVIKDGESVCYIKNNKVFYKNQSCYFEIIPLAALANNYSKHQLELVLASICITISYRKSHKQSLNPLILAKISNGLMSFTGLEHRFETLFSNENLRIINDSAASTPESVIKAIESIDEDITLITGGGGNKNLNYSELARKILKREINTILFSNDEPSELLINEFMANRYTNYSIVRDLNAAVKIAFSLVEKTSGKSTILFSPACSGYPMYTDMFERGKLFKRIVIRLNSV